MSEINLKMVKIAKDMKPKNSRLLVYQNQLSYKLRAKGGLSSMPYSTPAQNIKVGLSDIYGKIVNSLQFLSYIHNLY
ncbi:MAG: hypothetical protein ABL927_12425 [Bdellovibrionales bacterium]